MILSLSLNNINYTKTQAKEDPIEKAEREFFEIIKKVRHRHTLTIIEDNIRKEDTYKKGYKDTYKKGY